MNKFRGIVKTIPEVAVKYDQYVGNVLNPARTLLPNILERVMITKTGINATKILQAKGALAFAIGLYQLPDKIKDHYSIMSGMIPPQVKDNLMQWSTSIQKGLYMKPTIDANKFFIETPTTLEIDPPIIDDLYLHAAKMSILRASINEQDCLFRNALEISLDDCLKLHEELKKQYEEALAEEQEGIVEELSGGKKRSILKTRRRRRRQRRSRKYGN